MTSEAHSGPDDLKNALTVPMHLKKTSRIAIEMQVIEVKT
jgi:hypothetical protein